jgi:hypothetical protein
VPTRTNCCKTFRSPLPKQEAKQEISRYQVHTKTNGRKHHPVTPSSKTFIDEHLVDHGWTTASCYPDQNGDPADSNHAESLVRAESLKQHKKHSRTFHSLKALCSLWPCTSVVLASDWQSAMGNVPECKPAGHLCPVEHCTKGQ